MQRSVTFLTMDEIQAVLKDLHRWEKRRYTSNHRNLAIFRLSCCLGLRACEISGLNMSDLDWGSQPKLRVRKSVTKGKKRARVLPLTIDKGCHDDLWNWYKVRASQGAQRNDPFVCSRKLTRMHPCTIAQRWRYAIRILGADRVRQLSVHKGRHSFCTHLVDQGYSLPTVRDLAGHSNVATTDIYAHTVEVMRISNVFGGGK